MSMHMHVNGSLKLLMNRSRCSKHQMQLHAAAQRSERSREWGRAGGKLPRTPRRLGAPPSLESIKYTRMHHFEKKNSKIFSPEGAHENVCGAPGKCFPGPRCGSRRAWQRFITFTARFQYRPMSPIYSNICLGLKTLSSDFVSQVVLHYLLLLKE